MKQILNLIILGCLCLASSDLFANQIIDYSQVDNNPSYGSVTELSYQEATKKIAYGEDTNQFGLLWTSESTKDNSTLVVLLHGGCWLTAYDIQHTYPMATAIHQAGFNVWSLEYRRTGNSGGGWPTTYNDIQAGIKALQQFDKNELSYDKVIVAGHSAGGHLSLLVGRDSKQLFADGVDVEIVGLAAISDLATYSKGQNGCQKAGVQFMSGTVEEKADDYSVANPLEHKITVPITLLHGEADPIVPLTQTINFVQQKVSKQTVSAAGHFDWVHPGTTAFSQFLDTLNSISKSD